MQLSANVLVRPVMQDSIFPTAAYVGGPAEVAYFAQAGADFVRLNARRGTTFFPGARPRFCLRGEDSGWDERRGRAEKKKKKLNFGRFSAKKMGRPPGLQYCIN